MKKLTALFKRKNSPSFEELIKLEQEKLYRIAYSYMRNEQDALDVVQDAIVNGYKAFHKLSKPEYFSTWMTRILINAAINELRKRKKVTLMEWEKYEPVAKESFESVHRLDLGEVLERLKPEQRSLLIMRFYYGYSLKEIAEILGKPEGTVKSQIHRTLAKVRGSLDEGGEMYGEA
jgi:RNA polymerase sigma-70 factor (ECF subfamily)